MGYLTKAARAKVADIGCWNYVSINMRYIQTYIKPQIAVTYRDEFILLFLPIIFTCTPSDFFHFGAVYYKSCQTKSERSRTLKLHQDQHEIHTDTLKKTQFAATYRKEVILIFLPTIFCYSPSNFHTSFDAVHCKLCQTDSLKGLSSEN
jgi:hypothetical protein